MKMSTKWLLGIAVAYGAVIFVSNYLAALACASSLMIFFAPLLGKVPLALFSALAILVYLVVGLILPLIVIWLFFRLVVPRQYAPHEDQAYWIRCCAKLILPCEVARFLVCTASLGHINRTGMLAMLPSVLFENTYLLWSGRSDAVRNLMEYRTSDFAAFALCYLIYAAIHLGLVVLIYQFFWQRGKREREDLIVHECQVKYY